MNAVNAESSAITQALAAPFDPIEVKFKPQVVQGNRALAIAFVDARVVQDRLDEVLGVDGWQDTYEVIADGSVMCRLKVRIGSEWITKMDVGGPSEQPDGGDRTKAAFSDALKRTAVKFGVGRYLYRLPMQWVDYDPAKRQFKAKPTLPPTAIPRAFNGRPVPQMIPAAAPPPAGIGPGQPQRDTRRPPPPPPAQAQQPGGESAQICARFEQTLARPKMLSKPELQAIMEDIAKVKEKLSKPDLDKLHKLCRAALDKANGKAPTPETAPLDLVTELHQLIRSNRSRYRTWRATLVSNSVDLPQAFEEPETDDDLTHVCDWLAKADALRIRDGFRQAAANVRQHNGRGPEDDPPDPTDDEMAALDAATAG